MTRKLSPKPMQKALPRGLNKGAALARTAESKAVRVIYNVKAKRLNQDLQKITSNNKATRFNPVAVIRGVKSGGRNPGLHNFGAKQTSKGVTYIILKERGRQLMPSAFKAIMPIGGLSVFLRKDKSRLPIVRQTGPSTVQMVTKVGIDPIILSLNSNLRRLILREYKRELDKIR